jgi:acyl-CoA thioester hydrolase
MKSCRTSYRVIYDDTDQMGVVYHANYLRFFERGRVEYLNAAGFDYGALEQQGTFFAVTDAHVRFKQPARFNDLILIEVTLAETTRVRVLFTYRILRGEPGDEVLLATGETTLACIDKAGRPTRIPAAVRDVLGA